MITTPYSPLLPCLSSLFQLSIGPLSYSLHLRLSPVLLSGDQAWWGLLPDAAEGRVPDLRGSEERTWRSDRPHRHGGWPANFTWAVVLSAVRRPGPQVTHAVHYWQGTSMIVCSGCSVHFWYTHFWNSSFLWKTHSPPLCSAPVTVSRVICKERPGADNRSAEDRRPCQPHEP